MSTIKLMVVKCVTALLISTVMASSLVAFAAANPHTVTIIDGEKQIELDTYCTTAEEILDDAKINLTMQLFKECPSFPSCQLHELHQHP